jgi:transposase
MSTSSPRGTASPHRRAGPAGLERIRATLYHHGIAGAPDELRTLAGRQFLAGLELPAAARQQVTVALAVIDVLEREIDPVERELRGYARRQTGCQALIDAYTASGS